MKNLEQDDLEHYAIKHYQNLRISFEAWGPLDDETCRSLFSIFNLRHVGPKDFVAFPGDCAHELIYVGSGLLRFYYVAQDGEESNKAFISENEFAGPLASAIMGLPIYYGIQALEATTMLVAPFSDFVTLYSKSPLFERLGRKLAEHLLVRKEMRTRSLLEQNASERYRDFIKKHPNLVDRIPQYHLASYLGITEVSLSRLKNAKYKNPLVNK